ncbi:hypothetical protein PMG11_06843 [Penicillium brasilianum]|uniref:PHD-type domain-containing protein n=1 Tax=Penicillium brasilianum TaxID=104259 RepID=A0A0F7TT18_PENBI|nr:hypothetical protein PMG11_06843 [Penicillium brasilianum]
MGIFTRSLSRQAKDPQPAQPATPKRNKLQKKNPRQTRVESTAEGDAPVIETDAQPLEQTEWVEPPCSRARPTWANPDSYFTPQENAFLNTMRPIGQYPTVGDYKSVGLTPPTKSTIKRAFKLTVRATGEVSDAIITGSPTPITPVAEDGVVSDDAQIKADEGALSGVEKLFALKGSVEAAMGKYSVKDAEVSDVQDSSLATPISEAIGIQTANPSLSPVETPVDTLVDEVSTDPALTTPKPHLLTAPDANKNSLLQSESPLTTPALDAMDAMAFEIEKPLDRDLIAILNSLPAPQSNKYDVAQLKQIVATAISHSREAGNDEVALSLLHYWSGISDDNFKLSLIYNMGVKVTDHNLELALKTMLHHSTDDASEWFKAYVSTRSVALDRQDSGSDSSLSSAQSLEMEPLGQTFKVSEIYRDTSGPRLEDLFNSGKSNTAPLKRPRKPCRVNENSFKRRREWEADPSLDQTLQAKRARLLKDTEPEPEETMPELSSLRPRRGRRVAAEQPSTQGPTPDTIEVEDIAQSVEVAPEPAPTRAQRGGRGRGRGGRGGRGRGGRGKAAQLSPSQQPEPKTVSEVPDTTDAAAAAPPSALLPPTQVLGKRIREWSLDTTVSAESTISNECYSERENDWHGEFSRRKMPNSIEPPDNSDNCYECDQVGNLLCCDTCENSFHFQCLRPAVDPKNPPQGEWYCPRCGVRNSLTTAIAHGRHKKRKTEYSPPTELKEYFAGVGEGVFVNADRKSVKNQRFYKTVPHIPRLTKPPRAKPATPAYDDPNLLKMSDNGHVILCNHCGRCTDNERPIIRCDYCPSYFHLDCLDPPLAIPPNPHIGWMCPKHVTPDDMIVTKMVDGWVQERRVRRPKNTVASVDVDPIPYDDVNETTFDDDFREKRHLLPGGDMILDFISAVRNDHVRQQREFFTGLANTCINLARNMVEERLAQNSTLSADEITAQIAPSINEAIEDLQTGKSTKDQFDAALALVGFAKGDSSAPVGDAMTSQLNESCLQSNEADKEVTAAAPTPAIKDYSTAPSESAVLEPRPISSPPTRKSPRGTRKSKRSRAVSEEPAARNERASKRQHTESA